jgi:hypothetical protein
MLEARLIDEVLAMSEVTPSAPRRGRSRSVQKRRSPYLAAVATALAFAFLISLVAVGVSPTH